MQPKIFYVGSNLLKLFFSKNWKEISKWNVISNEIIEMLHLQKCQKETFDSLRKLQGSFQSEVLNKINTILQNVLVYLCLVAKKKKSWKISLSFTNEQTLRAKKHVSTELFLAIQTRSAPEELV